jgi:pimeloyl-ACP methyl ester carboxylesterase
MPYANNDGIRIYYEVEGEGPPLVLHHGLNCSRVLWRMLGLVDELRDEFRLVLMDSRGHGLSDKPHDPTAYALPLRAADVVAVLDDLGLEMAHYFGYSMGGWVGWGLCKHAPERFHSLIIGGFSPAQVAGQETLDAFLENLSESGKERYLEQAKARAGGSWSPEAEAMFSANDLDAILGAMTAFTEPTGVEAALPTVDVPCLVFGGELDPIFEGAEMFAAMMPRAQFVSLPGMDHRGANGRTDLLVPMIREFLDRVKASESGI